MDFIPEPAPTIRQLLAFYLEAGVDCALAEEPFDRLAEPDVPAAPVVQWSRCGWTRAQTIHDQR